MNHPRRQFLLMAASAAALPAAARMAGAQTLATPPLSDQPVRPLAERLAAYANSLRYEDLDAATVESIKTHLIDTLGCGIAAFDEAPVRICRNVALAQAGSGASIIGTDRRATPDLAAFANGVAFRYYDLNDFYIGRLTGHPSDQIAACLAVAEAERASATELITAIALVYEINCRLVDAFDITTKGWDAPAFSLPAVALAAGKLMKLDTEKLTQAVNIAINGHMPMGQTRVQTLSDWKGLADAEAGRDAVFAALLARGGITGPAPIFEGQLGFFRQVTGSTDVDVDGFGRQGIPFRINQCSIKAYPAQTYTQAAILASLDIAKQAGSLDRIASIEIATARRGFEMTGSGAEKWAPTTRDTADHSLPYIAARTMFDGDITNASYAPEKLRDPRILAFMRKITVIEDPLLTARTNATTVPSRITAVLVDGQRIVSEIDNVPGFVGRPMTRAEVARKFHANVGTRWPQQRTDDVLQSLWALERADDLTSLLGRFSVQT
jgi:2-methylcitrate dehydratase